VPEASSPAALARMRRQGRRDTKPELVIRRLLHARGMRYRVDVSPLPGMRRRADIVFTRARVAVFVDGCFWHGCPLHATKPKANAEWWADKLATNQARDVATDRQLRDAGWTVLRYWEHDGPASVAAEAPSPPAASTSRPYQTDRAGWHASRTALAPGWDARVRGPLHPREARQAPLVGPDRRTGPTDSLAASRTSPERLRTSR